LCIVWSMSSVNFAILDFSSLLFETLTPARSVLPHEPRHG
jgi:hypothetical protein